MEERLQKFLANAGIASRRKCEELIKEGKIQVNGMTVTELGTKINPQKDIVKYDGKIIKENSNKIYILLILLILSSISIRLVRTTQLPDMTDLTITTFSISS